MLYKKTEIKMLKKTLKPDIKQIMCLQNNFRYYFVISSNHCYSQINSTVLFFFFVVVVGFVTGFHSFSVQFSVFSCS